MSNIHLPYFLRSMPITVGSWQFTVMSRTGNFGAVLTADDAFPCDGYAVFEGVPPDKTRKKIFLSSVIVTLRTRPLTEGYHTYKLFHLHTQTRRFPSTLMVPACGSLRLRCPQPLQPLHKSAETKFSHIDIKILDLILVTNSLKLLLLTVIVI